MSSAKITTLFLDIGGVLLTNGWDRDARRRAAKEFELDFDEMEDRHHETFDTYEQGKLSLSEYLNRIVFFDSRPFSAEEFKKFMFAQSRPLPDMIDLVRKLSSRYGLKVAAVSNEGRELQVYRVHTFGLPEFIDFFVVSSFVRLRKPDKDIYRLALDVSQAPPEEVAYIDDRRMFVEVAQSLGIHGIHHTGYPSTRDALAEAGLPLT